MSLTLRAPLASKFVPDEFVHAQNKRTKQKGTRYCLSSKNELCLMAWSITPFGQTLDHLVHQSTLIFGGNRRGVRSFSNFRFVLISSQLNANAFFSVRSILFLDFDFLFPQRHLYFSSSTTSGFYVGIFWMKVFTTACREKSTKCLQAGDMFAKGANSNQ